LCDTDGLGDAAGGAIGQSAGGDGAAAVAGVSEADDWFSCSCGIEILKTGADSCSAII